MCVCVCVCVCVFICMFVCVYMCEEEGECVCVCRTRESVRELDLQNCQRLPTF